MTTDAKRSVAGYSLVNLIGSGTRIGLSFVTLVLASRWLGADDFGRASLILAYTIYLHYFLTFGFDHSLSFFAGRSGALGRAVLCTALTLSASLGAILVLIGALALPRLLHRIGQGEMHGPALVFVALMVVGALGYILGGYLRGTRNFLPVIVKDQILFPLLHLAGLVLFVRVLAGGLLGYAIGYAVATGACLLFAGFFVLRGLRGSRPAREKRAAGGTWLSWISFSVPVGVMNAMEPLLLSLAMIVSGWFLAPAQVAVVTVCIRVSLFAQLLLVALNPVFTPYLAELFGRRALGEARSLYQSMNFWSAKWALLFAFFIIVSSRLVLSLFGSGYQDADPYLMIILAGAVVEAGLGSTRLSLVMAGKNKINIAFYLVAGAIHVSLGVSLIPTLGIAGAAIAFAVSYGALNLMRVFWFYRSFGIAPMTGKHFASLGLMILPLAALAWFLKSLALPVRIEGGAAFALFVVGVAVLFWKDRGLFLARLMGARKARSQPSS